MIKKVFISHSTKNDENKSILDGICKKIDALNDFQVLVDQNITSDDEWFPCLYEYMWECHAAVILLSNDALQSEWVKAEAAFVTARRRFQTGFKLLLVPLEEVKPQHLDDHPFFNAIRLADFQTVSHDNHIDTIFNGICDALQELVSFDTPFEEMTSQIRAILRPIENTNRIDLEEAIHRLQPDFNNSTADVSDKLTRILLRDPENIFNKARDLFIQLSNLLDKSQAGKILQIVKGYWVHPEAASLLSNACNDREAVAINGREVVNFTGDCYAKQAWPDPHPYKIVPLSGIDRDFKKIEQTILSQRPFNTVPERLRHRFLYEKFKDPLILVFPFPDSADHGNHFNLFPEESLLDEIKQKLGNATVILSTGQDVPPELNYVVILEPLLKPSQEDEQYIDYSLVKGYIQEQLEG